jgi:mannan endo-1,4-beta-mannosidase
VLRSALATAAATAAAAVAAVAIVTCAAAAHADDFVRVDGTRFVAGGRPFAFVGANLATVHGQPYRERYEATLDAARADGLTVGRVWALGEGNRDSSAWSRREELFRLGPDEWVEPAFVQLDRVLAAARARHVRLIVTLANYWGDYGGVPAYLRWAGLPLDGWAARDRFFSDEKTRAFYRAHLARVIDRVNTVTGVRYADDPTIFAWELMNESQVDGDDGARARRAWIDEMAAFVRAHDPHHLVTPGLIGYGTRKERAEWTAVCRMSAVDYCDSHLYPQTTDQVPSRDELWRVIDDRVQLAHHVARKPIVFGEFGFDTRGGDWLGRGRAAWFGDFLARVFTDGAEGALVWIYQPWSGAPRDFGIYVDRGDTDDVRAVLRRVAASLASGPPAARNPLLGAARGMEPLYDPYRVARHPGRPRVIDDARAVTTIEIAPEQFDLGRFERVGAWDGGPLVHAYGAGDGRFEWRFRAPPVRDATGAAVVLRVSSEFPGDHAPPDGGSRVKVLLDGAELGELDAPADDGAGAVVRVPVDARGLSRLRAGGEHVLAVVVPPGARANGVCVYGEPTGHGAPPAGEATPIRVEIARPRVRAGESGHTSGGGGGERAP